MHLGSYFGVTDKIASATYVLVFHTLCQYQRMRASRRLLRGIPRTLRAVLSESEIPANVEVKGWLKSVRSHKNVTFAEISDGSQTTPLQAVYKGKGKAVEELVWNY